MGEIIPLRRATSSRFGGRLRQESALESLEAEDDADRRNGYYRRSLLTELGDIELFVPRTRRYCPTEVVRAYARRSPEIDRMILSGFVLGLSTRKLGEVLLGLLGRPVSPATVSRVAQSVSGGAILPTCWSGPLGADKESGG